MPEWFTDTAYLLYTVSLFLFIPIIILSVIAQISVQAVFNKYNRVPASSGYNAQDYARAFLIENGLENVRFRAVSGSLTDNFNPTANTISLSDTVRSSTAVGAIGVACHEAGHAVQHSKKFFFSRLRIKLVPVVNIMNRFMWPVFIVGFVLGFTDPSSVIGKIFTIIGLSVMGASMLFAFVTLPTEFDASRRAYAYLKPRLTAEEAKGVRKVLTAAAWTYVVSFMTAAVQFIRLLALLMMARGRNNRR